VLLRVGALNARGMEDRRQAPQSNYCIMKLDLNCHELTRPERRAKVRTDPIYDLHEIGYGGDLPATGPPGERR